MSFNVGENIGPYQIVEQLGQGGMATVYKAYHASLDRYVALKALHPAFNEDKTFASRFQREARVVAKLEHPNIVPVYDYAEHEGRPYLIMKFIEGDTLKARMTEKHLNSEEIKKVVDAVGGALSYAHKQGVLHRDIKPSNVLVATDGQIYLADFGLARIAQSGESTMSSDSIMGTPQYISPEQAMGKKDLDARTDLYSFGVMLYEMVVGQVPFSADTPFAIIHDHIYTPLPLPRKVNPQVPEQVERVLLKSLAKERSDRYDDAVTMIQAFKDAWADAGISIQGSPIKITPTMQAQAQPAQPQIIAPVGEPAQTLKQDRSAEAGSVSNKKRSPFVWIGVTVIVILCLGALIVARNNRLFARFLNRQNAPAVATSAPLLQLPQATQPAQILPTLTPPCGPDRNSSSRPG
jgi:serine/threonine protein kinase